MLDDAIIARLLFSALGGGAVYLFARYGVVPMQRYHDQRLRDFQQALQQRLVLDIDPKLALYASYGFVVLVFVLGLLLTANLLGALIFTGIAYALPMLIMNHLATKRREQLEKQLVDALTTLASGVRAGLTLVQAMKQVTTNYTGPIEQEFRQILNEYELGIDLNQAMRNASDRIGSQLFRLTFTAIEMHRIRGGDSGESMDRIAESIREIQRLEGKLDALTAQGRSQANFMLVMAAVLGGMIFVIDPDGMAQVFIDPAGRILLITVIVLFTLGFWWMRRILDVDI